MVKKKVKQAFEKLNQTITEGNFFNREASESSLI